jgi:hypothetical protein
VSNFQLLTLTLPLAGPLKSSAQTSFHGGGWAGASDADEHPTLTRTGRKLSPAASRRSRREALVRSPISFSLLASLLPIRHRHAW